MDKNHRLLLILLAIVVGMVGVAYAFVPMYRMFCQAFGIPVPSVMVGKAGAPKPSGPISDRVVTVRFIANESADVPVELTTVTRKVRAHLGESVLTAYTAQNYANEAMHGVAVHTIIAHGNVNASDVQEYVDLQQCFCFEEQLYPANEELTLPLSFTITPDLPEGIHTVTFAYTLFKQLPDSR